MDKEEEIYIASLEYSNKINAEDDLTSWSLSDAFIEGAKYRQSEIDKLTDLFRNFIREHHLTSKWEYYLDKVRLFNQQNK